MSELTTIKLEAETRDKINKLLLESGLPNQNEMVNSLIDAYKILKTREEVPELSQDIDELNMLLRRIESIYVGIGERFKTLVSNKDEELNSILGEKDSLIKELQDQLQQISNDNEINIRTVEI
jgi:hypothetical protein